MHLLDKHNKIYKMYRKYIKIIHIRISHFKQCKQYRCTQSLNESKFEVAFLIVGYGHYGSRSTYLSVDEFSSLISGDFVC